MRVCREYRISHSQLLGGPAGVWTDADRDKAIWWEEQLAAICPDCGTDPAAWDPTRDGHRRAYTAAWTVCPGCEVIERARDQVSEDERLRGEKLRLKPRTATGEP